MIKSRETVVPGGDWWGGSEQRPEKTEGFGSLRLGMREGITGINIGLNVRLPLGTPKTLSEELPYFGVAKMSNH